MGWSIILLKYSIAGGVVNALHVWKGKVLQQLQMHPCIHRSYNKVTITLSKTAPDRRRNSFAIFFLVISAFRTVL